VAVDGIAKTMIRMKDDRKEILINVEALIKIIAKDDGPTIKNRKTDSKMISQKEVMIVKNNRRKINIDLMLMPKMMKMLATEEKIQIMEIMINKMSISNPLINNRMMNFHRERRTISTTTNHLIKMTLPMQILLLITVMFTKKVIMKKLRVMTMKIIIRV
jgi:hypothetical protein